MKDGVGERPYEQGGDPFDPKGGCSLDGLPILCSEFNMRIQTGSVQTQYVGLYEADPNRPYHASTRAVPVTRDIRVYAPGIYEVWMPPEFRGGDNFLARGGYVFYAPPQNEGQQLSECLRNGLRKFFPKKSAQGKDYSPIDDARFKAGIPKWVNALVAVTPGAVYPQAITLGLYDIHYDDKSLFLGGGSSDDLKTILEEVVHTEQFIDVWAGLKTSTGVLAKYGVDTASYNAAQGHWKDNYAVAAVKALDYKTNSVEKPAKNRANDILRQLVNDPGLQQVGNLCGFDLKKYTIETIP